MFLAHRIFYARLQKIKRRRSLLLRTAASIPLIPTYPTSREMYDGSYGKSTNKQTEQDTSSSSSQEVNDSNNLSSSSGPGSHPGFAEVRTH